jgi:hypothetical protein
VLKGNMWLVPEGAQRFHFSLLMLRTLKKALVHCSKNFKKISFFEGDHAVNFVEYELSLIRKYGTLLKI